MRIAVFCGSRGGGRPAYLQAARDLGAALARGGHGLVYGGARVGTMGALADAALGAGAAVTGVMPRALVAREVAHPGLTEFHAVDSMHARKALMADLADGFIALPGGYGTFDELFEVLTWAQLGLHAKPVGLLDVEGFFGPLLAALDHGVEEGFLDPVHRGLLMREAGVEALLDRVERWQPGPPASKWEGEGLDR